MSEEPLGTWDALRQRRMFHWVLGYAAGAWGIVEATGFAVDSYDLSRSILDTVVFLIAVFFPVTIVLVWYHGRAGRQRVTRLEAALLTGLLGVSIAGSYQIATAGLHANAAVTAQAFTDLGERAVVVFPFHNALSDPEYRWLDRGLAEMLATHLAQIDGLRVVSGPRIFDLLRQLGVDRDTEVPEGMEAQITRLAGARRMLTGRILGTPGEMSIDAKLTDLDTGEILASTEARGADVFSLVDEVSESLCGQVGGAGTNPDLTSVRELATANVDAFSAFQRGREARMRYLSHEAVQHLRRAVALDPTFAKAYFELGMALHQVGDGTGGSQAFVQAQEHLTAASERDRLLIEGALSFGHDPRKGAAMLRELIRKYPDEQDGRRLLAAQLGIRNPGGVEVRRLLREAISLDPFDAAAYNNLAYHELVAGDFAAADSLSDRYIALEPGQPNPLDSKGEILEYTGRHVEARSFYRAALEVRSDFLGSLDHLVRSYLKQDSAAAARRELSRQLDDPAVETRVEAHFLTGDTHLWEGALDEGAASYRAAERVAILARRPDLRVRPLTELIRVYLDQRRFAEADSVMDRLRTVDADHPFAFTIRFETLAAADDRERLLAMPRDVEEFYASEAHRRPMVGEMVGKIEIRIAFWQKDYERVLEIAESMGTVPPGGLYGWPILRSMLEAGRSKEVLEVVRSRLEPTVYTGSQRLSPLPYRRLQYFEGRALEAMGDTVGAIEAYESLIHGFGDGVRAVLFVADAPQRLRALRPDRVAETDP
jgi:Flp pilus assembly protein TadD/TolB-like protein